MRTARKRPPRIVLVVACSQRKRLTPPTELRLASIPSGPEERAAEWGQRLHKVDAPRERAEKLYAGDHWHSAREAYRLARRYSNRAELWVISAGYGLIPRSKPIKPYGATFATGRADSVWRGPAEGNRRECLRRWWEALGHESALADLLPKGEDGAIVIAAGTAYLAALDCDLKGALQNDVSGDRISVISGGSRQVDALLPVDSRFRRVVSGTNSALNARVLVWLAATAESHRFRRSSMAVALDRVHAGLATIPRVARESTTDEGIRAEIQLMRKQSPGMSRTSALRDLRNRGFACEQGRFAAIWETNVPAD